MKITTDKGFECNLNEEALGDWEVTEKLIAVQGGDLTQLPGVLKDLLGEDGYNNAKEYVRNDKGRVPTAELTALFSDVLVKAGEKSTKKK